MKIDFHQLKRDTLSWLESLRIPGKGPRYKLSMNSGDSVFCSCFALFILDLFGEVASMPKMEKDEWISFIRSHQRRTDGYFEPKVFFHKDHARVLQQLTSLCLSALRILQAEPRFPISFIHKWRERDDVLRYLAELGVHLGVGDSGNKAMFLATFLTHEYEMTKNRKYLELMNAWFDFHNRNQNKHGFWGDERADLYYKGLQNGFHQMEVYFYWKRTPVNLRKSIEVILRMQDSDGHFAPSPGGGPCKDYDAIHVLSKAYREGFDRSEEVRNATKKACFGILECRNEDGGFCRSKSWPPGGLRRSSFSTGIKKNMQFILKGRIPYLWYYKTKTMAIDILKNRSKYSSSWVRGGHYYHESDLFSTWFRCLALAQIVTCIDPRNALARKFNFHKAIGIGYF